jgi:hypothetical protein
MNGLLSLWSGTAIAEPSKLTMLWTGLGGLNLRGGTYTAQPWMVCSGTTPCRFNSGGMPSGGTGTFGDLSSSFNDRKLSSMWVHGRGTIFVASDTSAKFVSVNANDSRLRLTPGYAQPYFAFFQEGAGYGMYNCNVGAGTPYYRSFFRPDSTFQYELNADGSDACNL